MNNLTVTIHAIGHIDNPEWTNIIYWGDRDKTQGYMVRLYRDQTLCFFRWYQDSIEWQIESMINDVELVQQLVKTNGKVLKSNGVNAFLWDVDCP